VRVFRPVFFSGAIRSKAAGLEQADYPVSTGDGFHTAWEIISGAFGVDIFGLVRHNGRVFNIERGTIPVKRVVPAQAASVGQYGPMMFSLT
jgi:hypothetical protein